MAHPVGYLPDALAADSVTIELPKQQFIGFGPEGVCRLVFSFFEMFLLWSID